jgi:hypothetical protein
MSLSSKISLSEFLSDKHLSDVSSDPVVIPSDTYENRYEFSRKVRKPSESYVEAFKKSHYSFSSSRSSIRTNGTVSGRYDINWLSPDDYLLNWNKLTKDEQVTFRMLVMSDFMSNSNRYGLKTKNLESHLLLNLGCDMNNIINSGKDSVRSNLRSPGKVDEEGIFHKGDFNTSCAYNRTVDAKTSMHALYKFKRDYDVEKLFKSGFVAYQAVIRSDSSYRKIKNDQLETKRDYHRFFRENAQYFSKLANKKKKIFSYVYSNEISVDSILKQEYRPHTHIIFFLKKEDPWLEREKVEDIERTFNLNFPDREMSVERIERDDSFVPRRCARYKDIEMSVGYLFRAYSLADNYLREIKEDKI